MLRTTTAIALAAGILSLATPAASIASPGSSRTAYQRDLAAYRRLPPWTARKLWKRNHRFDAKTNVIQYNSPIQHVVVLVMENRTVDNLFSGLYGTQFGQSGSTWDGVVQIANPAGSPALGAIDLDQWGDPGHDHDNFQAESNLQPSAPYNPNWTSDKPACAEHPQGCVPNVYSYVNPQPEPSNGNIRQIWPYQFITENFSSGDNVYQANQGPSLPAHQYLIAGQSGGYANSPSGQGPSTAPYALADNNAGGCGQPLRKNADEPWHTDNAFQCGALKSTYCIPGSPNHTSSLAMNDTYFAQNNVQYAGSNPKVTPCESYDTIFDLLSAGNSAPGTWEYHAHSFGSYWNAPALISRFADCSGYWGQSPPGQCDPVAEDVVDPEGYAFVTDEVAASNLAAVTYLTPCPADSDHPNSVSETGPSWVAWIVNAIGQNPNLWPNTAVIIVFDDWGGWYDHLPPGLSANELIYPRPDADEWGYRVPFMVVSAYPALGEATGTQGGYVSHQPRSMSSILSFIESNFSVAGSGLNSLGSLNADDSVNDNLADLFNFSLQPKPWPAVPASTPFTPLFTKYGNRQPVCGKDRV